VIRLLVDLFVFVAGLKIGDFAGKRRLLTKKRLKRLWLKFSGGYGPWSIGIIKGASPFDLDFGSLGDMPLLSGQDVTDIDALFVADPFLIQTDAGFFLFFEIMERQTERGCIGVAKSSDCLNWQYQGVAIRETFHLSFPQVFKINGHIYMVPESSDDWSVRLYQAVNFPLEWKYLGNLISGYQYKDPTTFFHDGLWWMFVSTGKNDVANLYFSKNLKKGWVPHHLNPVIRFDKARARSAGRVIEYEGRLYRMAQDNSKKYGRQVFAWQIKNLSPTHYEERLAISTPLVFPSGRGWNKAGMHTLNLYKIGNRWLGCVDGRRF